MSDAVLAAFDNWLSNQRRKEERSWREEKRKWRREDMQHRDHEMGVKFEECKYLIFKYKVRREIMQQRKVENSRYIWTRNKELNRREVEEKAEHMRIMSWITALIAGFTMTAPVEFTFNFKGQPWQLITTYAISTAIVPSLMTIAAMIAVCVLGGLLKMGKTFVDETTEEQYMSKCFHFADSFPPTSSSYSTPSPLSSCSFESPPTPQRTFDRFWMNQCEKDWQWISTLFSWGIAVFFLVMGCMAFLKFYPNVFIPVVFTTCLALSLIYWLWISFKWGRYLLQRKDVNDMALEKFHVRPRTFTPFDWHIRPRMTLVSIHRSPPE